jgi:hypothetical protein
MNIVLRTEGMSVDGTPMPQGFPDLVESFDAYVTSAEADRQFFQYAHGDLRDQRHICARVMHAYPELLVNFHEPWKKTSDRLAKLEARTGLQWPPPYFEAKPHLASVETFLSAPASDPA